MASKNIITYVYKINPEVHALEADTAKVLPTEDGSSICFLGADNKVLVRKLGENFRPYPSEFKRALSIWLVRYPTCDPAQRMYSVSLGRKHEQYAEEVCRYIPFVLDWAYTNGHTVDKSDKYTLWTFANYWHSYGSGPQPALMKKVRAKKPKKDLSWRENLSCPVCHTRFGTTTTNKEKGLRDYANWLSSHASQCQKRLTQAQAEKVYNAQSRRDEAREKRWREYVKKLEMHTDPAVVKARKELAHNLVLLRKERRKENPDITVTKSLERTIESLTGLLEKWEVETRMVDAQDFTERYRTFLLEQQAGKNAHEEAQNKRIHAESKRK